MKRILLIIATLGFCLCSSAQIQITTRKEKLSDFPTKTTKVVLTGNQDMDDYLKAAMKNIWVLSPFEFCTKDEFNAIKGNQDYYFMALDTLRHKKEVKANTVTLNVVKGGTGDRLKNMFQVAEFPICAVDSVAFHRLDAFLPAIVNVMQDHIKHGLYNGFSKVKPRPISKVSHKPIFIAKDDVNENNAKLVIKRSESRNIKLTETEMADKMFIEGIDALISYTFSPVHPTKGSVCYKMLFDARTYELYYFEAHDIRGKKGKGLQKSDIQKIAISK